MMLTDDEIRVAFNAVAWKSYNWRPAFIANMIAANNAKALEKLEPIAMIVYAGKHQKVYSTGQVSALVQRNEALEARVKELEIRIEDGLPL